MLTILAILLGGLSYQTRAPVPRETPADPLALGYMGITLGAGVAINEVAPKMPAEKAGLKAGDVIVRVGTLEPTNYEQVVAHICSFRPGAVVEVEVQRGTERKTFKVKLADRPPELYLPRRYPVDPVPEP
jgi:S1-C subfamily serine protease